LYKPTTLKHKNGTKKEQNIKRLGKCIWHQLVRGFCQHLLFSISISVKINHHLPYTFLIENLNKKGFFIWISVDPFDPLQF